jgi:hypothetical protein
MSELPKLTKEDLEKISKQMSENPKKYSIFSYVDNVMMSTFKINDSEYDFICENATDEELNLLMEEKYTFAQKRQVVAMVKKYKTLHANNNSGLNISK